MRATRHFAFVTANLFGGNLPQVALARELIGRGHSVTFVAHSGLESKARSAACDFIEFDAWTGTHAELRDLLSMAGADTCLIEFILFRFHDCEIDMTVLPVCHFAYRVSRHSWVHLHSQEIAHRELTGATSLPRYMELWRNNSPGLVVMSTPEFDGADREDDWVHYAGPFLGPPAEAQTDFPAPERSRALVVQSMNSRVTSLERMVTIARALASAGIEVIVTTSGLHPAEGLGAPGIRYYDMVDMAACLRTCDLLVSHAGHGGVMQGLAASVPILCDPVRLDQPANASRVFDLGAGMQLGAVASATDIRAQALALLETDRFRSAAADVGVAAHVGMEQRAAELIETLSA